MPDAFDLDAYFGRIGYDGPRTPTLDTLRAIHAAHPQAIPFENLDPLIGRRVEIDPGALTRKLVREGRGGYCYEHNSLLQAALLALGFKVSGLAARVVWNAPPERVNPRSHMLLRVALPEGEHIADVGFGGLTLTAPLRLEADIEQATPHGTFRLMGIEGGYLLETRLGDRWAPMYRFDLSEALAPDYEVANWYVSTNPASPFTFLLMAARALPDRRLALLNGALAIYGPDGVERRTIETVPELATLLRGDFGIDLPEGAEDALAKLLPAE